MTLFACVQENYPKATESIGKRTINILMRTSQPAADIVDPGPGDILSRLSYGEDGVKPDLQIEMSADTFHKILLGDLSLKTALGNGQMKVKGSILKAMSLGDLFTVSRKCYPASSGARATDRVAQPRPHKEGLLLCTGIPCALAPASLCRHHLRASISFSSRDERF